MNQSINHSMNHEAVYRTAPATLGLLNIYNNSVVKKENFLPKIAETLLNSY